MCGLLSTSRKYLPNDLNLRVTSAFYIKTQPQLCVCSKNLMTFKISNRKFLVRTIFAILLNRKFLSHIFGNNIGKEIASDSISVK